MAKRFEIELVECPRCGAAGGACSFCGKASCDESEIESHPEEANWRTCTLCGGEGEVSQLVAGVYRRREAARPQIAPLPMPAFVDEDIRF